MVAKAKHIYRKEYFEAQKSNTEGKILISTSLNQNVYLFISIMVLLAVSSFITFAEYTRRDTLIGIVSPLGGMIKVKANDSGYVEKLFVKEGDSVEIMSPLYEIKTERFDESGVGVKKRILSSINQQHKLLVERRLQESKKFNLKKKALIDDIKHLDNEISILESILSLSVRELELSSKLLENKRLLLNKKFLSELDFQKQQLDFISKQSESKNQNLNLQRLKREKQNLITNMDDLEINKDITLKDLDRQIEAMNQSKVEFLYKSDSQVRSPIEGIVASILAEEGHSVSNGQPLLVIVPQNDKAFVELYAPSRSIGFMKVGQKVRLRFDAFPYEKFGVQTGTITSISKSSVAPEMLANRRLINSNEVEGLYQVKVEMEKPTITVYGKEERLVSGMTVTADVELDTRKIYEWILEPLYSIKGKI
ncbi:HlyD family efflux transporter periplasmic adaptor subunit [Vibrio harveyi]